MCCLLCCHVVLFVFQSVFISIWVSCIEIDELLLLFAMIKSVVKSFGRLDAGPGWMS